MTRLKRWWNSAHVLYTDRVAISSFRFKRIGKQTRFSWWVMWFCTMFNWFLNITKALKMSLRFENYNKKTLGCVVSARFEYNKILSLICTWIVSHDIHFTTNACITESLDIKYLEYSIYRMHQWFFSCFQRNGKFSLWAKQFPRFEMNLKHVIWLVIIRRD